MWSVRSVGTIFVVVAAAVILPFAGYAAVHSTPVVNAGQVPGSVPQSQSPSDAPSTSNTVASSTTGGGIRLIAFLGDDYTTGAGASAPTRRFTTLVAGALGYTEANFGVSRTGYTRISEAGGDYTTRIAQVVAAKPSVVLVSGGRNDVSDNPATVADHARRLFAQLRAGLPQAKLIAVAPWWGDSKPRAELAAVAAGVQAAVQSAGGTYLDLADPLLGHPDWMADDADPNDAGYAAIAAALEPALTARLGTG